jgi:hypothetical protein
MYILMVEEINRLPLVERLDHSYCTCTETYVCCLLIINVLYASDTVSTFICIVHKKIKGWVVQSVTRLAKGWIVRRSNPGSV